MAGNIEKTVFEAGDRVAEAEGVYLVDAALEKEDGEKFLRLYIDKPGGVGIDDCERFSRAFESVFDELDAIPDAYCLEVSSPGVDRVLKTEREFLYYIGREVEVKLYSAVEGKKEFSGELTGYSDGTAVIDADGKKFEIPVSKAVYIRLLFRF